MELSLLELGQEVRRRRIAKGLSQQGLALVLNIPQAQISTLEQFGRGLKFEKILVVCKYLGLRMLWEDVPPEEEPTMVKVEEAL